MGTLRDAERKRALEDPRRVWILGAGFSRPLGGPLLTDLLSDHMRYEMELRYGGDVTPYLSRCETRYVYQLFQRGTVGSLPHSRKPFSRAWSNAEEFLVWLDDAKSDNASPAAREFEQFRQREIHDATIAGGPRLVQEIETLTSKQMWQMAKLLLAGETSVFIHSDDLSDERWAPYLHWVKNLSCQDTILTFNYDLVVERADLQESQQRSLGGNSKVSVWMPGNDPSRHTTSTPLLKLHGSSNWISDAQNDAVISKLSLDMNPFCVPPNSEFVIGIPGRSKRMISGSTLESLWRVAMQRISEATEILIVGYGFPRSDNLAKMRLVEAIRSAKRLYKIRIILGKNNDDAFRLDDLLRMVVDRTRTEIQVCRFWTEDLLAAWPAEPEA